MVIGILITFVFVVIIFFIASKQNTNARDYSSHTPFFGNSNVYNNNNGDSSDCGWDGGDYCGGIVEVAAGVVISFNEGSEKQKPSPKGEQERILFVLI